MTRVSHSCLSRLQTLRSALRSSIRFLSLLSAGSMRLRRDRVGERYRVDDGGRYDIFRDTLSSDGSMEPCAVLVVGFRLRLIGTNPVLHWVFQRICILTTPIWSGFPGFRAKLWMVDQGSKNYLGIYEWAGTRNARSYVDWLVGVLLPLSTKGSVWYEVVPGERLEDYLAPRRLRWSRGEAATQRTRLQSTTSV